MDGELSGELFYILNVFFFPTQSLSLSVWFFGLVTGVALKSKTFIHHVPLNILKKQHVKVSGPLLFSTHVGVSAPLSVCMCLFSLLMTILYANSRF